MDVRLDVERLDYATGLDPVVEALVAASDKVIPAGAIRNTLQGTWLGHPLHPLLTDLPIGCWTSAVLLDLLGGTRMAPAAQRLVGAGVVAALPTAAAGAADWTALARPGARAGVVHAAANTVALALYAASWRARRKGRRARGIALSFAGSAAVTVGGYLGGHLTYRQAASVSRNADEEGPLEWTEVADAAAVSDRKPTLVDADGVGVVVYRDGDRWDALADRCTHAGGPLHEGEVHDGCITCPWHGSTFRLDDGTVERTPAVSPQPAFDVREVAGKVQVRRRVGA